MPTFKGVTVEIHCPKDPPRDVENFNWAQVQHGPVLEHGTHKLRHTPKITSYIPAVTNCPFAVSITILDSYEPKVKGDDRESLAAYVYFDGKSKEETATLLRRGVETWISSRWIEVSEGQLAEREFVFREVGLENIFGSLDISKEKQAENDARRHSMPASMQTSDDESTKSSKPKESAGQIRVDLFRVRCEGPVRRGVWGDMFKDHLTNGGNFDSDVAGDFDVSHTAGFSDPKPLDKETVSTQSVSHLDPEGVVFASFIFFYRSEHQLRKIGMIKPPGAPTRSNSAPKPEKSKSGAFSSLSGNDIISKGPDIFKKGVGAFGDFRDNNGSKKRNGKHSRSAHDMDEDERLMGDELGRDPNDMARERNKTAEDVRMEEELAAEISKIGIKKRSRNDEDEDPETPPEVPTPVNNMFSPPNLLNPPVAGKEPETPAKKRKGSGGQDVKSPAMQPTRGLGFGGESSFGGPLVAMEEEEL
ncbi:hypothetical protein FPQ18DRAFT_61957 [Pyronema domesticum]|uniref:DUF7918 domain-containing protein n=1 Tax=Pyronema omphalodes (strain CBS 100304) TaxID=1076935 RepID=U4L1X9_PYROM|nr:hypothetical protein FPQ18DRAFT_61957 [Pyronema domesticum]CCX08748.1 Similar to hypothetical protein [Tuber melanosporum Mel28]; acc. no. XP_002838389 [Pyronema omphalodes CBS 100304]